MASNVFGSKTFKGAPPDKGSFPLDHDGECKPQFLKYMVCLSSNNSSATICKAEAKEYLSCRMDKNLMARCQCYYNFSFVADATDKHATVFIPRLLTASSFVKDNS